MVIEGVRNSSTYMYLYQRTVIFEPDRVLILCLCFRFPAEDKQVSVSVQQLYSMMQNSASNLLLIDIRDHTEYEESRINHKSCINIPAEIIRPGYWLPTYFVTYQKLMY